MCEINTTLTEIENKVEMRVEYWNNQTLNKSETSHILRLVERTAVNKHQGEAIARITLYLEIAH